MSDAGSDTFATAGPDQDTEALASTVERVVTEGHVPGLTLAVVRHDRLLHAAGFGVADLAERRPSTPSTQHLWFSMSKIATATAAMAMAERESSTSTRRSGATSTGTRGPPSPPSPRSASS